jgi:hypothetical protein
MKNLLVMVLSLFCLVGVADAKNVKNRKPANAAEWTCYASCPGVEFDIGSFRAPTRVKNVTKNVDGGKVTAKSHSCAAIGESAPKAYQALVSLSKGMQQSACTGCEVDQGSCQSLSGATAKISEIKAVEKPAQ